MTREQLDAIRARVERHDAATLYHAPTDLRALLAEVEQLTAEVESKVAQNAALIGMNGRLQQEVERLNALGALQSADIQRLTRRVAEDEVDWMALRAEAATAFARGAAAMREVAAQRCEVSPIHGEKTTTARKYADAVRALPDPEDKS